MVTNISYNVIIDRLKAFATGHYLIKHFSHGQIDLRYLEQDADYYPWMHVIPGTINPAEGLREYSFDITFSDLTRDKEHESEYIREAISDCTRLAEDLLAEIKNGNTLFDPTVQIVDGSSITPFIHEDTHTLTGVTLSLSIRVPWDWSACDIPASYSPGGSGSGGGAIGGCCVTLQVGGVDNIDQTLLNLIAGTNMTITDNGDGSVTFDSTGGGGGSVSWGSILGTLSNQTDLQNALNLKADISSLATVATTGDYNDLLNLPTIPTGLANLNDVNLQSLQDKDVLYYDNASGFFINQQLGAVAYTSDYNDLINQPTGLPPTGAAGGDLSGTYPNPNVHKIHGIDMQSGTPSTDEVWVYGGSPAKWQHQHLGADQVNDTSGVTNTNVKDALDHLNTTKVETTRSISTTSPLSGGGDLSADRTLSIAQANTSTNGYLSSTDWNTFNGKQNSVGFTTVGNNIATLANPSAITYLKIAADNTVSAITLAQLQSDIGLTSIGLNRVIKTSDQSTSANPAATVNVTQLTFPITAGKKYRFKVMAVFTTSTSGAGIKFGMNVDVAYNSGYQHFFLSLTQGGGFTQYSLNTLGIMTYSGTSPTVLLMSTVEGLIDASTTGNAIFQMSKGGNNPGLLTIKAGSIVEYYEY